MPLTPSVSSVKTLEDVKSDPRVLYMAMPVQVSFYERCKSLPPAH